MGNKASVPHPVPHPVPLEPHPSQRHPFYTASYRGICLQCGGLNLINKDRYCTKCDQMNYGIWNEPYALEGRRALIRYKEGKLSSLKNLLVQGTVTIRPS